MAFTYNTLDVCRTEMFTDESDIRARYPDAIASRVLRIREMYNFWLATPSAKDRQIRDQIVSRFGISQSAAYMDIQLLKQLIPMLSDECREFHLARANEMFLETYAMAKARKDVRTMERTVSSYSRYNRVDIPADDAPLLDALPVQPFVATLDVSVLGIEPIPNVYDHIDRLSRRLMADNPDIRDVECEEADLQEDLLFPDSYDDDDDNDESGSGL